MEVRRCAEPAQRTDERTLTKAQNRSKGYFKAKMLDKKSVCYLARTSELWW